MVSLIDRAILVEDNASYALELEMMLQDIDIEVVGHYTTVNSALDSLEELAPDLLIIDIELDGTQNGIDLAYTCQSYNIPIIIITSNPNEDYFSKIKDLNHTAFLIKPLDSYSLRSTILLVEKQARMVEIETSPPDLEIRKDQIFFKKSKAYHLIPIENILYIEADGDYCITYTEDNQFTNKITLSLFESILKNYNFFRSHRSFLINIQHLKSFNMNNSALTIHDKEIPISRANRKLLLDLFNVII